MTTGKKIALVEAIIALATVLIMVATFVVFIALDVNMLSEYKPPEGDASEQFGAALGEGVRKFGLIIVIIFGFLALIPSVVMSLISAIGQFVLGVSKRGVPTLGFVIVGMISKIFATVILALITSMVLGLGMEGPTVAIIHISLTVLMIFSFIWSIVALVLRKKVIVAKQNAVLVKAADETFGEAAEVGAQEVTQEAVEEIAPAAEYPNEE